MATPSTVLVPAKSPVTIEEYQSAFREEQLQLQEAEEKLKDLQLSSPPPSQVSSKDSISASVSSMPSDASQA
ncbi:hypothetical protein PM082_008382 [Marasmius tenuissimus]|nr:hypothetical protein PM082_008382 [Marasmius tenuissimus]